MTQSEALELAIAKWKTIAAYPSNKPLEGIGAATCALCFKYLEEFCLGCPVSQRTGCTGCNNTPYMEHWVNRQVSATREVKFLESLRVRKRKARS